MARLGHITCTRRMLIAVVKGHSPTQKGQNEIKTSAAESKKNLKGSN